MIKLNESHYDDEKEFEKSSRSVNELKVAKYHFCNIVSLGKNTIISGSGDLKFFLFFRDMNHIKKRFPWRLLYEENNKEYSFSEWETLTPKKWYKPLFDLLTSQKNNAKFYKLFNEYKKKEGPILFKEFKSILSSIVEELVINEKLAVKLTTIRNNWAGFYSSQNNRDNFVLASKDIFRSGSSYNEIRGEIENGPSYVDKILFVNEPTDKIDVVFKFNSVFNISIPAVISKMTPTPEDIRLGLKNNKEFIVAFSTILSNETARTRLAGELWPSTPSSNSELGDSLTDILDYIIENNKENKIKESVGRSDIVEIVIPEKIERKLFESIYRNTIDII
jgi:hypothetical protein